MAEVTDKELLKIRELLHIMSQLEECVAEIKENDEYQRIKNYVNDRVSIDLPYSSPFIEKKK